VKRFKNVSFSLVKTSLFDLNCGIRELRPRPQQTAKIAAGDTQLFQLLAFQYSLNALASICLNFCPNE
jgi:hypothetical protein